MTLDAATGDLVLGTTAGAVRQHAPVIYQTVGGERRGVTGGYTLRTDGTVGFAVGAYEPTLPLVIDPTLAYSTYLGGSSGDGGRGIAVDTSGNAYVTGFTTSTNFPVTNGSTFGGVKDVFVTKLDASGVRVYGTYLGGSGFDEGEGIAVDTNGTAYITGYTDSANFPVTNGSALSGSSDAFVTKIVVSIPLIISPATLPNGMLGTPYNQTITASGGTGLYTFGVTSGALPPGLTLTANGTLSGTPTSAGSFMFTVTATDHGGAAGTGSRAYTLVIPTPNPLPALRPGGGTGGGPPSALPPARPGGSGGGIPNPVPLPRR